MKLKRGYFLCEIMGILMIFLITGCISSPEGNGLTVKFPSVSEPVQITKGDKEHLFASYYGINSFSKSLRQK